MIKEIAFTAYPANDIATLRAWYTSTLGIPFGAIFAEEGVEKYAESNINNGYFSLMTHEWSDRPAGTGVGIVFEVDDLDKTVEELRAKGVKVDDPYHTPVCKISSLNDPEGNKVSLHQITVPH
jgi:predicted enzyme related to lactoylglutathione lyase